MVNHELNRADTAAKILDVAERLVQKRGFNGFSYADIAAELGVTKPALHYHFASKAELGHALIDRYATRFAAALAAIDADGAAAAAKLSAYAHLYIDVVRDQRMCLCGMLAAEYDTLPKPMRNAVIRFFANNEAWLQRVIAHGVEQGDLQIAGTAEDAATTIIGGLEGAMLVARLYDDPTRLEAAADRLLTSLT